MSTEAGDIPWKRVRAREITPALAGRIAFALGLMPIESFPSQHLSGAALRIACEAGLTVHDSLYLATALLVDGRLVTADRELVRRARRHPRTKGRVVWLGDLPPAAD